jgi:hypothetical protein
MSRPAKNSVSATQLSKLGYCENQVLLDEQFGAKRSKFVHQRAKEGNRLHERAHRHAVTEQKADRSPCFVATCIYGIDAPQTNRLRLFRDQQLLVNRAGRALVWLYYTLSPKLIPIINKFPVLKGLLRKLLDSVIKRI